MPTATGRSGFTITLRNYIERLGAAIVKSMGLIAQYSFSVSSVLFE